MPIADLSSIVLLPKCHHSVEDFLDFSRLRPPSNRWILRKRIEWNSKIFLENYLLLTLILVLLSSRRLLQILSILSLGLLWIGISIVFKRLSLNSRLTLSRTSVHFNELCILFSILGHVILFLFGTLQRTYTVVCLGILISFCHAMLRPVPKELSIKRDETVVVSSDGFTDDSEDVVEFISSPNSRPSSRSPGTQCVKRVRIKSLEIPLAVGI